MMSAFLVFFLVVISLFFIAAMFLEIAMLELDRVERLETQRDYDL